MKMWETESKGKKGMKREIMKNKRLMNRIARMSSKYRITLKIFDRDFDLFVTLIYQ